MPLLRPDSKLAPLAPKAAAICLIAVTGWMTRLPAIPEHEVGHLLEQFRFSRVSLDDVQSHEVRSAAPLLAPRFQHLEGYLTAFLPTGAALADLDGNGFPDVACTTDAFSRKVRIQTVPGKSPPIVFDLPLPKARFGKEGALPSGCLPGDYNRDGRIDLLVYFWGRTPVIYLNKSDRLSVDNFERVELLQSSARWYTQSMTSGDIDGDGDLDLVAANYFPDDAKILNDESVGNSFMNKGMGAAFNGAFNRLILSTPSSDGRPGFVEAKGVFDDPLLGGPQWTIAIALVDLDGDLLPEVFFLNDHGADRVLHNRTQDGNLNFVLLKNERDFTTPKSSTFGQDDYHAMGVDFGDLNLDGHIDWAISNFGADYLFHQSHFVWINSGDEQLYQKGRAPFRDASESLGLARTSGVPWDIRLVDFNNDGSLEVYRSVGFMRGTVNRQPELVEMALVNDLLFQFPEAWPRFGPNDSLVGEVKANTFCVLTNGVYADIGEKLGMIEPGPSRGMASADVDGDGRIDFLVTNQRASSAFYKNESVAGKFVGLDMRLAYDPIEPDLVEVLPAHQPSSRKGRAAVGAAIKMQLPDGKVVAAHVDGGSGYGGKKNPAIHIGLGDGEVPKTLDVEISWRGLGGKTYRRTIPVNLGWQTVWLGSNGESAR